MLINLQLKFTINIAHHGIVGHQINQEKYEEKDQRRHQGEPPCDPFFVGAVHRSLAMYPTPRMV